MALANERQGDGGSKLSKEDQDDIAAMDKAIERMRAFTPADPYVMEVPQEVEDRYRHQYKIQARQWLEHTPFDHDEHESSQYQTFIYHEPGKEMYMLHSSRPLEPASATNGDSETRAKEKSATGANTPNAGTKKISFATYKKKQTGQTPEVTPGKELGKSLKKTPAKGPVERLKEDEEVLAAVEEDTSLSAPKENEPKPEGKKQDLKRKREDVQDKKAEQSSKEAARDTPQESMEPLPKKLKPATPPEETESRVQASAPVEPLPRKLALSPKLPDHLAIGEKADKLPPKLSPPPQQPDINYLPPKLSPIDSLSALPSKLSPTIPTNMEATLKAQEHLRSASRSSDMPKDSIGRTLTPPPTKPVKKKSPAPRNGFRANSSSPAVRSDLEERGRPVTSVARKLKVSDAESAEDSEEIAVSRKRKAPSDKTRTDEMDSTKPQVKDPQPQKKSLMVKLKFKKGGRERVRALLRMKPQPEKRPNYQSDSSKTASVKDAGRRSSTAKGVAQKIGPAARPANGAPKKSAAHESLERKRSLPDESDSEDEAPATKRKKATLDASQTKRNEPSTPARSDIPSPAASVQKSSSQLSPENLRRDVLSVSMKRDLSTDSTTHTPNAMSHSPPASVKDVSQSANGATRPPSSQPSTRTPKQQAWEKEHKRLEDLGRVAKRAVPAPPTDGSAFPLNEKKLAAVLALESVLAFILAFVCADEASLASDPKRNPSIRPWKSLQQYVGFVKTQCEPFPVLQGLVGWLGVVYNAHIQELTSQNPSENTLESAMKTQAIMHRAAHDAEANLDVDVLQSTFPKTWARRDKGAIAPTRLEPNQGYAGPYKLPIGMQTSPLRAVRAGVAMLEEWIGMQGGLDYSLKLKL